MNNPMEQNSVFDISRLKAEPDKELILCVDDDLLVLDNLKQFLIEDFENARVVVFDSGKKALDYLERILEKGYALTIAIIDEVMPEMRGTQLLPEIKNISPHTKTILLTGQAGIESIVSVVNKGCLDHYIAKPWDRNNLSIVVSNLRKLYINEFAEYNYVQILEDEVQKRTKELQDKYEELKETKEKLVRVEKLNSLGMLTAGICHEINNPNNYIIGCNQIIKDRIKIVKEDLLNIYAQTDHKEAIDNYKEIFDEIDESLITINKGSYKIHNIVQALSVLSHQHELKKEEIDINILIRTAVHYTDSQVEKTNTIWVKKDLPKVICNGSGIKQVLVQLLKNAMDSKPESINLVTEYDNHNIRIIIMDTGCGIAENIMPKIFDPFYSTKKIGDGIGMGLTICHGIVEGHNGKIEIKSELNKGTEVTVTLPVAT